MVIQFLLLFSILILLFIIRSNMFRIEGLTNSQLRPQPVLLIGDSMLKNDTYVDKGYSVSDQLRQYTKVDIVARDGAKVQDISQQLLAYQPSSSSPAPTVVISIGGNNILEEIPYYNEEDISSLFDEYKNTIIHIKNTLPTESRNIILCNIYYPPSYMYRKYDKTITTWNKRLDQFASKHKFKILNVATAMNAEEDFTHEIEPSRIGGGKIVETLKGLF